MAVGSSWQIVEATDKDRQALQRAGYHLCWLPHLPLTHLRGRTVMAQGEYSQQRLSERNYEMMKGMVAAFVQERAATREARRQEREAEAQP